MRMFFFNSDSELESICIFFYVPQRFGLALEVYACFIEIAVLTVGQVRCTYVILSLFGSFKWIRP